MVHEFSVLSTVLIQTEKALEIDRGGWGKNSSGALIVVFPSDRFTAKSTLGPSTEGNKLQPMSVVLFLKISNSFLETFKCRKRVVKVSCLLS